MADLTPERIEEARRIAHEVMHDDSQSPGDWHEVTVFLAQAVDALLSESSEREKALLAYLDELEERDSWPTIPAIRAFLAGSLSEKPGSEPWEYVEFEGKTWNRCRCCGTMELWEGGMLCATRSREDSDGLSESTQRSFPAPPAAPSPARTSHYLSDGQIAADALAGTAGSPSEKPGNEETIEHREGVAELYSHDGRYLGCIGEERWRVLMDSEET